MKLRGIFLAVGLIAATISTATPVEASIVAQARAYEGLHERINRRALQKLMGVNPISVPWCGSFIGAIVKKDGKRPPAGYRLAQSWVRYGKKVSVAQARAGDVVVLRTKYGYHVALIVSKSKNKVRVISGNQSNRVKVTKYSIKSIVAIRR